MQRLRNWMTRINHGQAWAFSRQRWQGTALSLLALLFLLVRPEISYYLFLYAAGWLYAQLFFQEKWTWLRKLLVAPFFSGAAIILICGLSDLVGLPVGVWCLFLVWLGSLIVAIVSPFVITVGDIRDYRRYLLEIGIGAIFIIGLAARIIPVWNEPAPILHDPVQHAEYAKIIMQTGHVEYFYSPGLHFHIAMSALTTRADLARSTLMLTQFFNGLICVAAAIFVVEFSRRKWWAFLAAAFFAVGDWPAGFYTGAGKNALVFTTGFILITWAVFHADIGKIRKIVLCNVFLLSTILSHYPAAVVCCVGLGVLFLLSEHKKQFIYSLIFAVLIGALWGAAKYPYQTQKSAGANHARAARGSIREVLTFDRLKTETVAFVDSFSAQVLMPKRNYAGALVNVSMLILLLFGVRDRKYWFLPLASLAIGVLMAIEKVIYPYILSLWIVMSTQGLTQYIFTWLVISFSLSILLFELWEGRNARYAMASAFLVLAVVVQGAFSLKDTYTRYTQDYSVVQKRDIEAFKWMTKNLDPQDKILVDARIQSSTLKTVVFAGDSGVWIPVYTDFKISADFLRGFSMDVLKTTQLYLKFAQDPDSCELRAQILNAGYKYYFQGSRPVHATRMTVTDTAFKSVFRNSRVQIYQILPCGG